MCDAFVLRKTDVFLLNLRTKTIYDFSNNKAIYFFLLFVFLKILIFVDDTVHSIHPHNLPFVTGLLAWEAGILHKTTLPLFPGHHRTLIRD